MKIIYTDKHSYHIKEIEFTREEHDEYISNSFLKWGKNEKESR